MAHAKITVRHATDDRPAQWHINGGDGAELRSSAVPKPLELFASMKWHCIRDDRPGYGPWRITTREYVYLLKQAGEVLWAMHWHPETSPEHAYPHMHLGAMVLAANGPITRRNHLRTGRMTFEDAIRSAIDFGAEPIQDDWSARLVLAETPHLLFRSWSGDPTVTTST